MNAYDEGRAAKESEDPEPDNPYPVSSDKWLRWCEGWRDGLSWKAMNHARGKFVINGNVGGSEGWRKKA